MKNQNKTRFEVGMNVMLIDNDQWIPVVVDSIHIEEDVVFAKSIDNDKFNFNLKGFRYMSDSDCIIAYTIPEYEALKKLTDSFIDGTFGDKKEQPKFNPQGGEPVIYKGSEYIIEAVQNWYILKHSNGAESVRFVSPVEGYQYANGFCDPILKEQTETPQPKTTNLIDDNGKPVYFEVGMDVGCIANGLTGVVSRIDSINGDVIVNFPSIGMRCFTYEGKDVTGVTMLFPIEIYNQIKLPKLQPIQVAKSDVIELPSWFSSGATITAYHVAKYITDNFDIEVRNKLDEFITASGSDGMELCEFYECYYSAERQFVFIRFSYGSKLFAGFVYPNEMKFSSLTADYIKNGQKYNEKLC